MRISEYFRYQQLTGKEDLIIDTETGTYKTNTRKLKEFVLDNRDAPIINWSESSVDPIDDYIYVQNSETGEQKRINIADFIRDILDQAHDEALPSEYDTIRLPSYPDANDQLIKIETSPGEINSVALNDFYEYVLARSNLANVPLYTGNPVEEYLGVINVDGRKSVRRTGFQTVADAVRKMLPQMYVPKGSCTFEDLHDLLPIAEVGWTYNILNDFTTTDEFTEGPGADYAPGTNVVKTIDGKWDCLGGVMVYGIKGIAERNFRTGQVIISPEDLGFRVNDFYNKTAADTKFLSKTDAQSTYLSKVDAQAKYVSKEGGSIAAPVVVTGDKIGVVSGLPEVPHSASGLFSDGIGFKASITDGAWVRLLGTTETNTVLEIAVSDDGGSVNLEWNEEVVLRKYNGNNEIMRECKLIDKHDNTILCGDVFAHTNKKLATEEVVNNSITAKATELQQNFQAGCNTITSALTAAGISSGSSPNDIAGSIGTLNQQKVEAQNHANNLQGQVNNLQGQVNNLQSAVTQNSASGLSGLLRSGPLQEGQVYVIKAGSGTHRISFRYEDPSITVDDTAESIIRGLGANGFVVRHGTSYQQIRFSEYNYEHGDSWSISFDRWSTGTGYVKLEALVGYNGNDPVSLAILNMGIRLKGRSDWISIAAPLIGYNGSLVSYE